MGGGLFGENPGGRTFFFSKKVGTLCGGTTIVALFIYKNSESDRLFCAAARISPGAE